MKEKFVDNSINLITKYQECDELKYKKLKYGLSGLYSLVVKLSICILISIITNSFKETILFLLFYSGIRTFSFGIHAKSNITCWITTIIFYNIIPIMLKNISVPYIIGYVVLGLSFISMLLFSPADTPKRPLIRKKQRDLCKKLSLLVVIIYTLIYLLNISITINNMLIYALIVQDIFINPITYKLTKTKYNNYLYYHKKS